MPRFDHEGCHGGGLYEHVSICKEKNEKKLDKIIDVIQQMCGSSGLESFEVEMYGVKWLNFVVTDLNTMKTPAWMNENMGAVKVALDLMPDPLKVKYSIPLEMEVARELCACLIELEVMKMCTTKLELLCVEKPEARECLGSRAGDVAYFESRKKKVELSRRAVGALDEFTPEHFGSRLRVSGPRRYKTMGDITFTEPHRVVVDLASNC
jgi:hypothetical protein